MNESLSPETEGGFFFSFSSMENHKQQGQDPGRCGDCIDYPVTGIFSFDESLSPETEGGFSFLSFRWKTINSRDRILANVGIVLITQ